MPSIKTRESLRTIKTFDRAKTLGQKVKNGAGEVKEYGEELQNTRYESANEYAGNVVENTERRTARTVAYGAGMIGKWGLKETRKNLLNWRNRPKKFKVKVQADCGHAENNNLTPCDSNPPTDTSAFAGAKEKVPLHLCGGRGQIAVGAVLSI